jgi:hypothetical protein
LPELRGVVTANTETQLKTKTWAGLVLSIGSPLSLRYDKAGLTWTTIKVFLSFVIFHQFHENLSCHLPRRNLTLGTEPLQDVLNKSITTRWKRSRSTSPHHDS